jgi:N-acetylneuraminic acid mutarotase
MLSLHAQTWVQQSDYPSNGVDDGTSFVIGDKAYCGSGIVSWFAIQRDFYAFDLNSESWSNVAAMPQGEGRQYANGFASDSFGFVFGGYNNNFLNDLWRYNPQNDQWLEMTSLPDSGRSGAASFVIDSIAYIIGGKNDSSQALNEVWAYNMNQDSWQRKNDLPFGTRWRSAAAANDSLGYLAFGMDDTLRYCKEVFEYKPSVDQWTKLSDFPQGGRNYVKMHWIKGKLLAFGGADSSNAFFNELWSYDVFSNSWEELSPLPAVGRRGGMSFHTKQAFYYTTGLTENGDRLIETWKWVETTSLVERNWSPQLKLYPNPTEFVLTLEHPTLTVKDQWHYELRDSQGQLIDQQSMKGKTSQVQLERLPRGVYLLFIQSKQGRLMKQVMKL